ncbi:MAG: HDOD domain-containing protein [Thermoguttaceae bacterium]
MTFSIDSTSSAFADLTKLLAVDQIPAMPHSALSILQIDNDVSKVNINDLVKPIEADPGLASQVLKFLNSSYFGFRSTISSVRQGIALVGIRVVKNFVLWKAVFSLMPRSQVGMFDVNILWQDSLRRAMFSRFFLQESKKGDPEIAFVASLLQDMAIPLLLKLKGTDYGDVLTKLAEPDNQVSLSALEESAFGWNHAQAGSILAKNWKLPPLLIELIGGHSDVEFWISHAAQNPEQVAVSVSSLLPTAAREDWREKSLFEESLRTITKDKKLDAFGLFNKVDEEYERYAAVLQIAKPKLSLNNYLCPAE